MSEKLEGISLELECINWKHYRLEEIRKATKFSHILFGVLPEIRTTHFRNKELEALSLQKLLSKAA